MEFAEKIARLREAKGWNKAELARRAKVSPNTVGNWEEDERRPFQDVLHTLGELFGVPVDYLVDEDDERTPAEVGAEMEVRKIIGTIGWDEAYARLVISPLPAPRRETPHRVESTDPSAPPRRGGAQTG